MPPRVFGQVWFEKPQRGCETVNINASSCHDCNDRNSVPCRCLAPESIHHRTNSPELNMRSNHGNHNRWPKCHEVGKLFESYPHHIHLTVVTPRQHEGSWLIFPCSSTRQLAQCQPPSTSTMISQIRLLLSLSLSTSDH